MTTEIEHLKYPIGKYNPPAQISFELFQVYVKDIEALPILLRDTAVKLSPEQLNTPYRPDGWTAKQVIHHLADSHLNAYIRTKWTLTENTPTIKAYNEVAWAELPDSFHTPIQVSLDIITALHARWASLLHLLDEKDIEKTFSHPSRNVTKPLKFWMGSYAWHGKHHLGHLRLVENK